MKTTVKYVVLKSKDYQLGTPLFEEELDVDGQYFDQIPLVIHFQNRDFKVKSKELQRKQIQLKLLHNKLKSLSHNTLNNMEKHYSML